MQTEATRKAEAWGRILTNMARLARNAADVIEKRPDDKWQASDGDPRDPVCFFNRNRNGGCAIGLNLSSNVNDAQVSRLETTGINALVQRLSSANPVTRSFSEAILTDLGFSLEDVKRCPELVTSRLVSVQICHDRASSRQDCVNQLRNRADSMETEAKMAAATREAQIVGMA